MFAKKCTVFEILSIGAFLCAPALADDISIGLFEEMESYVDYSGLTPLEAITTATLNGAKSIGIEETHGTLEVGKKANMVILKADPSRNIRNAREIKLTIKNGKFYDRSFYNPVRFNSIVEERSEISSDWDKKEKQLPTLQH